MYELKNVDLLPKDIQPKTAAYLNELLKLHGENIAGIYVYGSAAAGNFMPGVSDVNLLVVLRRMDFAFLQANLRTVAAGLRQKIPAPLVLTQGYLESSVDVFPVEFLDIQDNHLVLYGEDIFAALNIPKKGGILA